MRKKLEHELDLLQFLCLRRAEQRLPVDKLYSLLKPLAFTRAILNTAFKNPRPDISLPPCLEAPWTIRMAQEDRMSRYLNQVLEYFPDRLGNSKWQDRCQIVGGDGLAKARQEGRPVVAVFCHFGPYRLLRPWIRASGVPSAALVGKNSVNRPEFMLKTDRLLPHPNVPTKFYLDELKAAAQFLAAGNVLFTTLDGKMGKHMDVPFCDGWRFQMATGAIRLAIRHAAELIPCSITEEGPWRFRIEIGQPTPREFLTSESRPEAAANHLIAAMLPTIKAHPEQCGRDLILRLRRNSSVVPQSNPPRCQNAPAFDDFRQP